MLETYSECGVRSLANRRFCDYDSLYLFRETSGYLATECLELFQSYFGTNLRRGDFCPHAWKGRSQSVTLKVIDILRQP